MIAISRSGLSLLMIAIALLPITAVAADKKHFDKVRGFSVLVPDGWTSSSFPVGPLALKMEVSNGDLYANCSVTVVDSPKIPKDQNWIDTHVNTVPFDKNTSMTLLEGIKEPGDTVTNYYSSLLDIGGKKSPAVFYWVQSYSKKVRSNLYFQAFYAHYLRSSSALGITCLTGGVSRTLAQEGFETYNATFKKVLSSVQSFN